MTYYAGRHKIHPVGMPAFPALWGTLLPGSVFSKIFTSIFNKRLTSFTNSNNIVTGEQAGFRRDYLTVDNGFVLRSVFYKYLN